MMLFVKLYFKLLISKDALIEDMWFIGIRVKVHPLIIRPLKRVEARLLHIRRSVKIKIVIFFRSLRNI